MNAIAVPPIISMPEQPHLTICSPPLAVESVAATAVARADMQVRDRVQLLMNTAELNERRQDKRHDRRIPYPYPVYLTCWEPEDRSEENRTVVVLGKHLAERGLDFYHREPLPYRRMVASFDCGRGRWISLLLALDWCRFNRHGWYDSGGRFLQAVTTPVDGLPT